MSEAGKDKLIVRGIPGLNGEYECDIAAMLDFGGPGALTNREGHQIKVMSGTRAGELDEELRRGDNDTMLALAAIVLTRHGKDVDADQLWDAPMGAGVDWEIAKRGDDGPPAQTETPGESS